MNYLSLINGFNRWLETNPLDPMAQLLMFKFLDLFNGCGWEEWITVDNLTLMSKIKTGREATLIRYRDKLVGAGLLQYRKGKKGMPNRYRLTFKNEVQRAVKSEVYPEVQRAVQAADILKQDETRQNHSVPPVSPAASELPCGGPTPAPAPARPAAPRSVSSRRRGRPAPSYDTEAFSRLGLDIPAYPHSHDSS